MKRKISNLLHKELSYQVHGAAVEVRKDFGPGHKERLYQKAFEEELRRRRVNYEREKAIKIFSPKDGKFIGLYRPDFLIDNKIIVEIKAEKFVSRDEIKRMYDYLRNSEYELAYFINFVSPRLYVKRVIFTNDRKPFHKKLGAFLLVFISLIFVSISGVYGQESISPRLSVSPHTFELDVLPGEIITDKIKISNRSEVPIPIAARTIGFTAADETGGISFDEFSQDISFASQKWIKIENPNFILDPAEGEEVHLTISVPENAEPGGHYATLLFEPKLPSFYFEAGKPRAIPIIGVLFLFSVRTFALEPEIGPKLEIVEFSVPKEERLLALENLASRLMGRIIGAAEFEITKKSPSGFLLRIKNRDIYHIRPFGKVLIFNIFGKKIGEIEVPQKTILPGKIRQFQVAFSPETPEYLNWLPGSIAGFLAKNFFLGKYQARLELQAKSPTIPEILQPDIPIFLTLFSFPWKFWLSFILTLSLFIFFVLKYKKRIKLAIKLLLKSKNT